MVDRAHLRAPGDQPAADCPGCGQAIVDTGDGIWAHAIGTQDCAHLADTARHHQIAQALGVCDIYCSHGGVCLLSPGHGGLHDTGYCRFADAEAITRWAAFAMDAGNREKQTANAAILAVEDLAERRLGL